MISPDARVFCALFIFPLLLPAETQLPRPPETPYIYEYLLPPGPARPIDEYLLRKESPQAAAAAPAAVRSPAEVPTPPAPARSAETVPTETSRPVGEEEKAAPFVAGPGELADLEPDLYARLEDSFSLYFAGDTWLFTESYPDGKGVEYRGRSREGGGMRFSFRARKLGRYLLAFVLGGSGGGAGETKRVLVEILPEEEFLSRIGADETGGDPATGQEEKEMQEGEIQPRELYDRGWELLLAGKYTEGYELLSSPELEGTIEKPELDAALFLSGILAENGDVAVYGSIRGPGYSAARREEFIDHILKLSRRFDDSVRLTLLHAAVDEFGDLTGADRLFFELAGLYQKVGEFRDVEAAIRYYGRIIDEYPLSPLWDEAQARRIYLERHFLLVR